MPTAVESYAKLSAVLVYLPQTPATHLIVDPNNDFGQIGGRNGRALHQTVHHGHVAQINGDDATLIGGRSGHTGKPIHKTVTAHASDYLLPAVQGNMLPAASSNAYLIGLLLPAVHDIGNALREVLQPNQKMIEVLGIGTQPSVLAVLIGLLRAQGFHGTIASCDGSVRPGFLGPTAVLRAHGGAVAGQFLQQLATARQGDGTGPISNLPTGHSRLPAACKKAS